MIGLALRSEDKCLSLNPNISEFIIELELNIGLLAADDSIDGSDVGFYGFGVKEVQPDLVRVGDKLALLVDQFDDLIDMEGFDALLLFFGLFNHLLDVGQQLGNVRKHIVELVRGVVLPHNFLDAFIERLLISRLRPQHDSSNFARFLAGRLMLLFTTGRPGVNHDLELLGPFGYRCMADPQEAARFRLVLIALYKQVDELFIAQFQRRCGVWFQWHWFQ